MRKIIFLNLFYFVFCNHSYCQNLSDSLWTEFVNKTIVDFTKDSDFIYSFIDINYVPKFVISDTLIIGVNRNHDKLLTKIDKYTILYCFTKKENDIVFKNPKINIVDRPYFELNVFYISNDTIDIVLFNDLFTGRTKIIRTPTMHTAYSASDHIPNSRFIRIDNKWNYFDRKTLRTENKIKEQTQ